MQAPGWPVDGAWVLTAVGTFQLDVRPGPGQCPLPTHTGDSAEKIIVPLQGAVLCSEDINTDAWQHWESILRDDGLVNYREDYGILVLNI